MEIYAVNIENVDFNMLMQTTRKNYDLKKLKGTYSRKRYKEKVIGNMLLEYIFTSIRKYSYKDIKIKKNKFGKPYLADSENLFYNISHSGKWIICVIHEYEIGIDIEKIVDKNFQKISNEVFSSSDIKYLNNIKSKKKILFYKLWTLREAYLKYIGCGLDDAICDISFSDYDIYKLNKNEFKIKDEYFFCMIFEDDYVLSLCTKKIDNIYINKIEIQDLLQI